LGIYWNIVETSPNFSHFYQTRTKSISAITVSLPLAVTAYKAKNAVLFSFGNIRREKLRVAV
jgi:hypothetical protein